MATRNWVLIGIVAFAVLFALWLILQSVGSSHTG
jgi:hypothetical protein